MPPVTEKRAVLFWLLPPLAVMALHPLVRDNPDRLRWAVTALSLTVLFFSVVIHELSHGAAAYICGDFTAHEADRLTLNPLKHVSLVGSIVLPLILFLSKSDMMFGWAKPVPFNPMRLRNHPRDQTFISLAGPLSNLALSFASFALFALSGYLYNRFNPAAPVTMSLNLHAPLDFSGMTWEPFWFVWFELLLWGMMTNAGLAVFNLIPFPPLDGFWVLKALLPARFAAVATKVQGFGFILLIVAVQFRLIDVLFYPAAGIIVGYHAAGKLLLGP